MVFIESRSVSCGCRGISGLIMPSIVAAVVLLVVTVSLGPAYTLTLDEHHRESVVGFNANNPGVGGHHNAPIDLSGNDHFGRIVQQHAPNITAHRVDKERNVREGKSLPSWDYAQHGADWTHGMCKIGRIQSPVDLHVDGLTTHRPQNIKDVFESVLKGNGVPHSIRHDWKRGDMVYTYRHLISSVQVLRTDKVFRLSVPPTEGSAFGALFTTDKPNLYMATHIEFHSPSEHTFEGSANRRQVEVQIWHYYGDEMDGGISAIEKNETTDMNVIVTGKETSSEGTNADSGREKHLATDHANGVNKDVLPSHEHGDKKHDGTATHKVDGHFQPKKEDSKPTPESNAVKHSDTIVNINGETISDDNLLKKVSSRDNANRDMKSHGVTEKEGLDEQRAEHGGLVHGRHESKHQKSSVSEHPTGGSSGGGDINTLHSSESVADGKVHPSSSEESSTKDDSHNDIEEEEEVEHGFDDDSAKLEKDESDVSFIEIMSDVEMADGTHVISPKSAEKERLSSDDKDASGKERNVARSGKNTNGHHPLKTARSSMYSDMVENDEYELLNKYLLDHLHNATYDQSNEKVHISEKRKARSNNMHWGRWAVLSMTFMSEEMEKTRIETLKSFPSERFMEQVLKVGSEVEITDDDVHTSVGELNSGTGADLPVVELDSPINLSSLLMMIETKDLNYFAYDGSFTRPGCEETVRWYVAKESLPVSTELMLKIHRMLNQTRNESATSEPINKYRELQNVDGNLHNAGKVHLVHGYPMEYFIATSFDRTREPSPEPSSSTSVSTVAIYAAAALVALLSI